MTSTVHLTVGLPGSGKSTFAKQLVSENSGKLVRVNMDEIRTMLSNGVYSPELENAALKVQDHSILSAVNAGYDVIVDNTNLHPRMANRIRTILHTYDVNYVVHSFLDVPVEECVRRDAERTKRGERSVGRDVIEKMARRQPKWRLTAEYMSEYAQPAPYEPKPETRAAYLVDLDGTLALHNGRDPYATWECLSDQLNVPLANVLDTVSPEVAIILLSGRDSKYRDLTKQWLEENQVSYDALFMRAEGDTRRDDIVKAEIFDREIRDNYNVEMAWDDRDRVVALWRSMGIMTAQMNFGDF